MKTVWALLSLLAFVQVASADTKIRIVAANLSSGNHQSYDPGDGARILKGLNPDVVLIQEFNYGDRAPKDFERFVKETFGPEYDYQRESTDGDTTTPIPNGVISRYPILEKGEWEDPIPKNRDFTWARIAIPGEHKLWAISVHLKASNDAASKQKRKEEAESLVALIHEHVPEGDYVVVGGDFNTYVRTEPAVEALKPIVSEEIGPENPTRDTTKPGTSMNGKYAYDWVLASDPLRALMVPVTFTYPAGTTTDSVDPLPALPAYASGLIFDSTKFEPLLVVPGVQREDSRANGMQHLAVVKDFLIPEPIVCP